MFSWYKYLIVSLVFSHHGFWSGSLFLIAPLPDLCLLVLFYELEKESWTYMYNGNEASWKDFIEFFLIFHTSVYQLQNSDNKDRELWWHMTDRRK